MAESKSVKREKITKDTQVYVKKNFFGSGSYRYDGRTKERYWEHDCIGKNVKIEEIQEVMSTKGGYDTFEKGMFLIEDGKIREYLSLRQLDECVLTEEKILELFKDKDIEVLRDRIEVCYDHELDLMAELAIREKISDMNILSLIQEYTNIDLVEEVRDEKELSEKVADKQKEKSKTSTGRQKREKIEK